MPDLLRFNVLTPGKTLLDVAQVHKVRLKLADHGWLSVYPYHAPLLAETLAGPVVYTIAAEEGTKEKTISLFESILQVAENKVTLFTAGELTASTPVIEDEVDTDTGRFNRLARVLMKSLGAIPGEELREVDPGTEVHS